MVSTGSHLFIIGGENWQDGTSQDIYQLKCGPLTGTNIDCEWEKSETQLQQGRREFIAMQIPNVDCVD